MKLSMKTMIAASALTPSLALAHADHSHEPLTLWHALTQPDHAAMIAAGIAVLAVLVMKSRAARRHAARQIMDPK